MPVSSYERSEFNMVGWPVIGTVDHVAKQLFMYKQDIERFFVNTRFSLATKNYVYDFITPGLVLSEEDQAFICTHFLDGVEVEFYSCPVDMLEIYKNAV